MTELPMVMSVTVTLREIYDKLVRVESTVNTLADQIPGVKGEVFDHEVRIRAMERRQFPLPVASLLISLAALVVAFGPMLIK